MRTFLAISFVLAMMVSASAESCTPTTTRPTLTVHLLGAGVYVAEDPHWLSCEFGFPECGSIWVYEESNGIVGLQRDDDFADDTCGGQIAGDTVLL